MTDLSEEETDEDSTENDTSIDIDDDESATDELSLFDLRRRRLLANDDSTSPPAPAREHSYLKESHPLLPKDIHPSKTTDQTRELAVLELHGVILFPGCTIPVKLQNRSMIRYIGKQIRLCRDDPLSQPLVQIGILPYEARIHQQQNAGARTRRNSWMRQRFSFGNRETRATASSFLLRQSLTQLRDEFELEDDERSNEDETPPSILPRSVPSHPLVGRIGTIATVQQTHERTTCSDDATDSTTSLWRRYEEASELVFTAVGTSRFRIVSCISDEKDIFEVEEFLEDPLVPPSVGSWSIPRSWQPGDDYDTLETKDCEITAHDSLKTRSTNLPSMSERMAWNLSQITPVPYFVYNHWMPWSLVREIVAVLKTDGGRLNLPTLGDFSTVASRKRLEPTSFSYWMANNAPFSEGDRLKLLKMNSVMERLLFIRKAIQKWTAAYTKTYVCCGLCETSFTTVRDIFKVGGAEGMTSNYVNGAGMIHQITTVRMQVDHNKLAFQGDASVENSYFPGYSWRITICRRCGSFLGWLFQKVRDGSFEDWDYPERPSFFFGFVSSNVVTRSRKS